MPSLKVIEEKTKLKPSWALLLSLGLLVLFSPLLNTYGIVISLICYLVPAYLSFIALESTDKEDDIRYLTYWIIFSVAEVFSPFLRLFFNKFMYMAIRVLLSVALLHPLSNATSTIYNRFVRPFLSQH